MRIFAKVLEAIGIALLLLGYVIYLNGGALSILYYDFFIGIGIFLVGRYLEKRVKEKTLANQSIQPLP
ncbi:MAG: hypothetical protein KGZ58_12295 [Ignavibacteriales bacterium]|nr:hypothetical protein [Ignavibacteriales bacterium]